MQNKSENLGDYHISEMRQPLFVCVCISTFCFLQDKSKG